MPKNYIYFLLFFMAVFAFILTILIGYAILEISLMLIGGVPPEYLCPSSVIIIMIPLSMITYLKAWRDTEDARRFNWLIFQYAFGFLIIDIVARYSEISAVSILVSLALLGVLYVAKFIGYKTHNDMLRNAMRVLLVFGVFTVTVALLRLFGKTLHLEPQILTMIICLGSPWLVTFNVIDDCLIELVCFIARKFSSQQQY